MKKVSFVLATVMLFNSTLVWGQSTPIFDSLNVGLKAELELTSNKKPTKPSNSKANNEKKAPVDKKKKPAPGKKEDQAGIGLKLDTELVVPPPPPPKDEFPMEDILKMQNDKEVVISSFSAEEKKRVLEKYSRFIYAAGFKDTFYKTMFKFLNAKDAKCESTFISSIIHELKNDRVERNESDVLDAFKYLRATGAIDDIMYDILEGLTKDYFALTSMDLKAKPIKNVFKDYDKKAEDYDLKTFFKEFTPMPDEVTKCGYREFNRLQNTVGLKSDTLKKRHSILKDLIFKA